MTHGTSCERDPLKLLRVPWVAAGAVGRGGIRESVRVRFRGSDGICIKISIEVWES